MRRARYAALNFDKSSYDQVTFPETRAAPVPGTHLLNL
jgi:hypothetical protein